MVSIEVPLQKLPPLDGFGLVHCLFLDRSPSISVSNLKQLVYFSHGDQPPSTGNGSKEKGFI